MKSTYKNSAILGVSALIGVQFAAAQPSQNQDKQPNLLFIFADQFRTASLGFLGQDPVETPHIDRLARQGVYFSEAVSNHPLSSPFRGMLLTGQYPITNTVISNCNSMPVRANNFLKKETVCFTDVLAANGYDVGYVGKWHLDAPPTTAKGETIIWDTWCPPDRRHGINFWYSYGTDNDHMRPHYWANDTPADEPFYVDQWSPEHEAEVIMGYLKDAESRYRDKEKPFAMFWSINPPHTSFTQLPQRYIDKYVGDKTAQDVLNRPNVQYTSSTTLEVGDRLVERSIDQAPYYFALVNGVDDQIGRVLDALREQGLDENTIVIFASDHGEMLGSQGLMHKNIWFTESFSIPLIVHYPKAIKPGVDDLLISTPDYMPTILGFMGLGSQIPATVEGRDFSAVLRGGRVERPDYQLYFGTEPGALDRGKRGFKTDRYTFAVFKDKQLKKTYYLYDNKKDPFQMVNLWGAKPKFDRSMEARLDAILRGMGDPWVGAASTPNY